MQIINLSINLSKIDKSRLIKGEKGTYLNATLMLRDEKDQYGNDGFIVENVTKEEREKAIKGNILGNAKIQNKFQEEKKQKEDDLPF